MNNLNILLKKAKDGDSDAINVILEEYSKILSFNANKYYLIGAEQDDLKQEGLLGLLKAIKLYDESKNIPFNNFANLCVRRQMITAIKKANRQKHILLNESLREFEDTSESLDNNLKLDEYVSKEKNPEENFFLKEKIKDFKKFSNENFSKFEKKTLNYLIEGYSYREIAKILEKDLKSIDNAIQRIRKKSETWIKLYEVEI